MTGRMHVRRVDPRVVLGPLAAVMVWVAAWLCFQRSRGGSPELQSAVAIGASIDFVVTAGLVLYVIAIRRGRLPRWVLGATLGIGFLFARLALGSTPDGGRVVTMAFILVELVMITMVVVRGRKARRAWREARMMGAPALEALTSALVAARFPPRLAAIVATEFSLLGAAVTGWRRPVTSPLRFTVHRTNGWPLYAGVLMFLIAVESIAVHIALVAWVSPLVAWIATATSLYSLLWLVGDVHALRHSGATIGERDLELAIGVRWRGRVPWSMVESIEAVAEAPADAINAGILGANVSVRLRAPVRLHGVFGRVRESTAIALSIDERDAFVTAARAAMLRA
jgi:hypothetical protein